MGAFQQLPFQYQQRGPDLAEAKDTTLAKFHEQRDQDLENYLANLSGVRQSFTIWSASTVNGGTDVFNGGNIDWVCAGGVGGFDATGAWTGTDPFTQGVAYYEVGTTQPLGEAPGLFEVNFVGKKSWLAYDGTAQSMVFNDVRIVSPGGNPGGAIDAVVKNMDLQTSTGPFTGPGSLTFSYGSVLILVVD